MIAYMFSYFKTLVDIKDFRKQLITEFTSKGCLKTFKNENVPAPKKQASVNKAGLEEEGKKDFKEQAKLPIEKHMEIAREIANAAVKLNNDSNKGEVVIYHKDIKTPCKERHVRICWS